MKALSIRQPWAHLILHRGKDIENRDWRTNYRGRVLVHASKGMTKAEYADGNVFARQCGTAVPFITDLLRGGILGTVEIVDCVTDSESPWFCGPYGFVLRDPEPFAELIPYKGALGLFEVPLAVYAHAFRVKRP